MSGFKIISMFKHIEKSATGDLHVFLPYNEEDTKLGFDWYSLLTEYLDKSKTMKTNLGTIEITNYKDKGYKTSLDVYVFKLNDEYYYLNFHYDTYSDHGLYEEDYVTFTEDNKDEKNYIILRKSKVVTTIKVKNNPRKD